jgi:hypothetical protein
VHRVVSVHISAQLFVVVFFKLVYFFVFEEQEEERKQARVRESAPGNRGSFEIILLCTGILS